MADEITQKVAKDVYKKSGTDIIKAVGKVLSNPFSPDSFLEIKKIYDNIKSIPDQLFCQKIYWYLQETQNIHLSQEEKEKIQTRLCRIENEEELYFQLYDLINKAYNKQHIHYLVNALIYSFSQNNDEDYLSKFFSIATVIQRTDISSLKFLIEKVEREANWWPYKGKSVMTSISSEQYGLNFSVSCLCASGLMTEIRLINEGAGDSERRYRFTLIGYDVYKYITCQGTRT